MTTLKPTSVVIPLSEEACALIELALREAWANNERDIEKARQIESPQRQQEEDSLTVGSGRLAATAESLVKLLGMATGISVTVNVVKPNPDPDGGESA